MNTEKVDDLEDQLEWNMATSAIRTGRLLRAIGSVLSVLSVVSGIILALMYLVVMEGDYAVVGVVMSVVGIVPAFAMGQFLSLYGTRGVLHGIQVQNTILDLDTDE
jgi:hypothetical protein